MAGETGDPYPDLGVYAFDGETYTGFHGVSDENGQVVFTLPEGDYRFWADYDGFQFWSNTSDHCAVPGCTEAGVAIPGGLGHEEITIDYTYDPLNRLTAASATPGTPTAICSATERALTPTTMPTDWRVWSRMG